jgi:PAS domain S-box-containing protein
MSSIYLTPASISYLTQFILSLAITAFLARHLRNRNTQLVLLIGFFAGATGFIGLMFLDAALSPFQRLLAVYVENTVLALALVFLLQFAYRFPRFYTHRKWEAHASLIVSMAYLLWEGQFTVYRYVSLLGRETVYYRPPVLDYANALVLLWVPIAFLRQCTAADPRSVNGLIKLWKPQGKEARGARSFVFVFAILAALGVINLSRGYALVSTMVYNISMSIGILVALWLFASSYINFIPGRTSFLVKLSILTLTLFLAMLGSVGWMIVSPYIDTYRPDLTDHQTLRFTPNTSGGYDVAPVDFAFETRLGDRLQVTTKDESRNHRIDFPFPFYGQSYTEIYVASSGVIGIGEAFWQPNMQAHCANLPAIFPLMIDLDPNAGGGVYARQEPDRLIVTWDHLPAVHRPEAIFTFQVILYQDGVFDITYNGLPSPFRFAPDETPSANPWVRGVTPGRGECLHTSLDDLSAPRPKDQLQIVQNYQLDFRQYLHEFILPLGWVIAGGSLLLLLGLPTLLDFLLVRPLDALSAGVRQMEAGDLNVQVPIQNQDEIGFLTGAFNHMASRLSELVTSLEERVAERTAELSDANAMLKQEIAERRRAEEALQELNATLEAQVAARTAEIMAEREKSEAILHSAADAILMADRELRVLYVNPAFTTLTGYTAEEALGQHVNTIGAGAHSEQIQQSIEAALAEGKTWQGEVSARRKDGRTYDAALTVAPVRDADGSLVGSVSSHWDISQRKGLERARSQFINNVSHQFRTPVTTLKLYAQLMQKTELPEKSQRYLEIMEDQIDWLTQLIQDTLEMTALDSGKAVTSWEPISLSITLQDTITHYQNRAETSGLNLMTTPLPPDIPTVTGDQARLTQAIVELVENAITFTPPGGQVVLEAGTAEDKGRRWLTLAVQDTGPGISPEEQEKVFDRFFRGELAESGHTPGTGLGLSIAQEIVRAHGGRITVESQVGEGSTFTIWLPLGG